MKDKHVLITGATSGIGKATAWALGNLGAHISFTGRHREKGLKVQEELRNSTGNQEIFFHYCDLASFASVTEFTTEFSESKNNLAILINNAGIWHPDKSIHPGWY